MTVPERSSAVAALHAGRPRSVLARLTLVAFLALVATSVLSGTVSFELLFDERRQANAARFFGQELMPFPLRESGFSWVGLGDWAGALWREHGRAALLQTLGIAVLAIGIAALAASFLAPLGARTWMRREPYVLNPARERGPRALVWRSAVFSSRLLAVLLRAVPEYVWAFLLLAVLGPSAWAVVLALALHNAGILARLGADTLENLEARPLRALVALGATRRQLLPSAGLPAALPRMLLYVFYRYETCVREATVLGMVGVVSLGYWIEDARARLYYDDMLFFVLLGAGLVLLGDGISVVARAYLRRSS